MRILVTGCAGFIGLFVTKKLLSRNDDILGIDNMNEYYDPELKKSRINQIKNIKEGNFTFIEEDLCELKKIESIFKKEKISKVIHLAATPGVRYSIENPHAYTQNNLVAFTNVLELCRHYDVDHLTYASTSSVYGANTDLPYSEKRNADHPLQFYAATKKANEVMAHSYSYLYNLPTTGLRFFTVYGPWTRPDMALFIFAKNILERKPIQIFNEGKQTRDFTYVEDIADGIVRANDKIPSKDKYWKGNYPQPSSSTAPFRLYNIGSSKPTNLMTYIELIEKSLNIKAEKQFVKAQPGDAIDTSSDNSYFEREIGKINPTDLEEGIKKFTDWFVKYYKY